MEVRPGYKQTEVGVFPEDWDTRSCSEVSERIMVGVVIRPTQYYVKHGIPAFRSANIRENGISDKDLVYISDKSNALLEKSQVRTGDVLTVRTGYPGTSAVVRKYHAGANCIDVIITRPSARIDSDYLAYWVNSSFGKEQVLRNQGGLAQKHFNVGDMRNLVVALPSPIEQRAITTALSDVDTLIAALEKLIAKKRDIKQAAMQKLLTGQTRLPGFSGKWEGRRLDSIADILKGKDLSKSSITAGGARPCILYGELFTTYGQVISQVLGRTNSSEGVPSMSGDVLMPGSTTTTGADLASASAILEDGVALGGDILIIRRKGLGYDPTFLANYLTFARRNEISELTQGITIHHLYGKDLKSLTIQLPPLPEQTAIATVISDIDAELATLESRLTKTRAIKQGMMQELLTGRTRLI